MAKYIEKESILRGKFPDYLYKEREYMRGWNDALEAIAEHAPSADVAPVERGKWLGKPQYGITTIRCSVCNDNFIGSGSWKYCPSCGAKMGEEGINGEDRKVIFWFG